MLEDIHALDKNHTQNWVDLPKGKNVLRCKQVFIVKINPDGFVARLNARLINKGYAQTYGADYEDNISLQLSSPLFVFFISLAILDQPLYQLDIKNPFLYRDLYEEMHIEQKPGFVSQESMEKFVI